MQILKKIAFSSVDEESTSTKTLFLSYRSAGVITNTGTLCASETANIPFYIYSSTRPVVSSLDVAYNTNNLSSPFNGGNKYYKVAFSDFVGDTYLVQIDGFGLITVIEYCGP